MTDDDARELLAAWALDAVDDVERAAVERAMRADPALAAEGRALRETALALATHASAPAPDATRAAVLAQIATTPQVAVAPAPPVRGNRRGSLGRVAAVAAAFVLGAAVPTGVALYQASQVTQLERQTQALDDALARPGARLVQAPVTGGGTATAIVAEGATLFTAHDLPALEDGDYQLWVIADGAPTSAGLLEVSDGGTLADVAALAPEAALAVTVEPVGGSLQPTTEPLVVLSAG